MSNWNEIRVFLRWRRRFYTSSARWLWRWWRRRRSARLLSSSGTTWRRRDERLATATGGWLRWRWWRFRSSGLTWSWGRWLRRSSFDLGYNNRFGRSLRSFCLFLLLFFALIICVRQICYLLDRYIPLNINRAPCFSRRLVLLAWHRLWLCNGFSCFKSLKSLYCFLIQLHFSFLICFL